ncbi:hypothetical protein BSAG_05097 [Bacteroides sp. D1]|nr:hypothetical protein BSAG_05097 [Bacteroides sp. D1]
MNDTYDRCFFHYVAFNSNLHRNESIFKDVIALNQIPPIFRLSHKKVKRNKKS